MRKLTWAIGRRAGRRRGRSRRRRRRRRRPDRRRPGSSSARATSSARSWPTSTRRWRSIATGSASTCRARRPTPTPIRALRNMFGLPDAYLRWLDRAAGRHAHRRGDRRDLQSQRQARSTRRMQDTGAFTLIAFVRDMDATLARLKTLRAPIVTPGGVAVDRFRSAAGKAKLAVVTDPAGHFVELVQPDQLPETQAPPTVQRRAGARASHGAGRREGGASLSRRARHARVAADGCVPQGPRGAWRPSA